MTWSSRIGAARRTLTHPVRVLPMLFLAGIVVGTALLALPVSRTGDSPVLLPALFTSTSAVTVTGLATVDTATFWTPFGQAVILLLMEVGGFGITTIATVLGMAVGGRLGMRTRMLAQAEMRLVDPGGLRQLLRRVAVMMLGFQLAIAVVLAVRYRAAYYDSWGTSLWHGVFHSVGAFNNAGFALESDSLVGFAGDLWIVGVISLGVFVGALGFPVMAELYSGWRSPSRWTIHTRLTVWGSVGLLVVSVALFWLAEWTNPATLGPMDLAGKLVTGVEGGVMPRSGGFNSFDWGEVRPETLGVATIMMFIGGGSASTAGGIKVTTFLLLAYVILAEVRGDNDVTVGNRRIGPSTLRQALTIALISVMLVAVSTLVLLTLTDYAFDVVLFEVTSAFATVGLSTGITPDLTWGAQLVLMMLMFVGRVGTVAAASALALRSTPRQYRLPEERPIIG